MRNPPLKRLSAQQKRGELDALVSQTERRVRDAYAEARREVAHTLALFAVAYEAEYDRVNADREDDEPPRNVPAHWLISSGWGARVEAAMRSAANRFGQRSLAAVGPAHDDAARLGMAHATDLIRVAMQPAVDALRRKDQRRKGRR